MNKVQDLLNRVDTSALLSRPLSDWRPVLSGEVDVYVFGENYIAKRFDQINYKFCEKNEAKEILVDNLYALLRYKYFPSSTEEIDDRINKIVSSFTANLKTTLKRVSFDSNSDSTYVRMIPDSCVAFRNGVFDFAANKWLFKYDIINLDRISNKLYTYTKDYFVLWYFDYNFEPLDWDINASSLEDFIDFMKEYVKISENYCFELMYNIAHDKSNAFDIKRFKHLCEILGYALLQSFSQHFVMLIGAGQNGKNSLFDGCFSYRIVPRPAANDLDAIENDRFITGALENKSHNIFLETSTEAKTYKESKMIKALTGSMYQTIESKGVSKYSGLINCKYILSANDQDRVKFEDTTTGFTRRINMFEIFYQWDPRKQFMKRGDYYDTSFSDSLKELKDDILNTSICIYMGMYGIKLATSDFTKNFKFDYNDYSFKYMDIDFALKEKIESLTIDNIAQFLRSSDVNYKIGKDSFFDVNGIKLEKSEVCQKLGYRTYDAIIRMFEDAEAYTAFFAENDIYLSMKIIQSMCKDVSMPVTNTMFTQTVKKIYSILEFKKCYGNTSFVKVSFNTGKLKVLGG